MSNNREVPRLDDLAMLALLKNSVITLNSDAQYHVLMQYQLKAEIPVFLKYIADAKEAEAKELLERHPELATVARGTVETYSGHIIKNVTAIQLAYLLDDYDMGQMMLPFIEGIPNGKAKARQQLTIKMIEVKEQESQPEYDFTSLAKAISADQPLKNKGLASTSTMAIFDQFKADFKSGIITHGRPFRLSNLKRAYQVYEEHWEQWNDKQFLFFLRRIIGLLQAKVPPCYAQAFSQGLEKILTWHQSLKRRFKLKNLINNKDLCYYPLDNHTQLRLGRDIFVDIKTGFVSPSWYGREAVIRLLDYLTTFMTMKQTAWENLCKQNELIDFELIQNKLSR